jgi:hypothetical protein
LGRVKRNPTRGLNPEKLNIEHRTSNIECLMEKDEATGIGAKFSAVEVCFSFEVGRSMFNVRCSLVLANWVPTAGRAF